MTIEEAMETAECVRAFNLMMALDVLVGFAKYHQEVEKNNPLTLDELREMAERCEAVYVKPTDDTWLFRGKRYCVAVLDNIDTYVGQKYLLATYGDGLRLWDDDYGKTWIAYRYPPKEAHNV